MGRLTGRVRAKRKTLAVLYDGHSGRRPRRRFVHAMRWSQLKGQRVGFRLQVASDVRRDGLGLELLNDSGEVVAEVFRCDANNSLEVSLFDRCLPFVEVERLFRIARAELGAFEDGTALPTLLA